MEWMNLAAITAESLGKAHGGDSFTLMYLFTRADWVVRSVMIMLVVMSLLSWAIMIDRWLSLSSLNAKSKRFEEVFWSGGRLDDLGRGEDKTPMSVVLNAAMKEAREAKPDGGHDFLTQRIDRVMQAAIARESARLEGGLTSLATIASASPFIGLFGTVWGIMNSFRAIAASQDTNLATVAPGIAEALFATALGLLAAIPATVFYNKLSTDVGKYTTRLQAFSEELSARILRRLSEARS